MLGEVRRCLVLGVRQLKVALLSLDLVVRCCHHYLGEIPLLHLLLLLQLVIPDHQLLSQTTLGRETSQDLLIMRKCDCMYFCVYLLYKIMSSIVVFAICLLISCHVMYQLTSW